MLDVLNGLFALLAAVIGGVIAGQYSAPDNKRLNFGNGQVQRCGHSLSSYRKTV